MSVGCRCFVDQVAIVLVCVFVHPPAWASEAATPPEEDSGTHRVLQTDTGVEYGIWGDKSATPAPTLFVLSGTIEETLGDPYFRQSGNILAEEGYLCVSVDLPCHGRQRKPDEPNGLDGCFDCSPSHTSSGKQEGFPCCRYCLDEIRIFHVRGMDFICSDRTTLPQ